MNIDKSKTQAPAVDHAVAIINLIAASSFPLTLSEICKQTDMPAASAHRVINSLVQHQMVSLDPRRKRSYSVGSRIFEVASTVFSKQSLIPFFYPIAEILKNEIHLSILLSVPVGNQMVVVSKVEPSLDNTFDIYIGQTVHMHESASGKALLSMQTNEFRQHYFSLDSVTNILSKSDKKEILDELERAALLGYSVNYGESDGRISTMAAPVMNLRNEPVATISIVIKSKVFDPADARQYSKNLVQAARQLSSRII